MNQSTYRLNYILQIVDNALINGQRLSEWCGHGPVLEQDIAITNMALDHIGTARSLCQYAADIYNSLSPEAQEMAFTSPMITQAYARKGKLEEDDIAYLRDSWDFHNVLLAEQPNEDWAYTIARSFFIDTFNFYFYTALQQSKDETLAAVAEKSLKEGTYHLKWSSEWVIRLGDGTEESSARMQAALNARWAYTGELLTGGSADISMQEAGIGVDIGRIKAQWQAHVSNIIEVAALKVPEQTWMQQGGKEGQHTEHLGYILAEMQYLQRTYQGMEW